MARIEAREVETWCRHQHGQAGHEAQGLEHEIRSAVTVRGLASVPRDAVVDELARDELTEITLHNSSAMSLPVTALYSRRLYLAAKTRLFLDCFIEHVDAKAGSHGVTGRSIQ